MSVHTPSPFCDRCNAVIFDDLERGGSVDLVDGKEVLRIGPRHRGQELSVDFQLNDPYPSLPSLSRSAEDGCKFCGFLKETVTDTAPNLGLFKPGADVTEIEICLRYDWRANSYRQKNAAFSLVIMINGKDSEGQPRARVYVQCPIESVSGPCASWLRVSINRPGCVLTPDTISWIQNNLDSTAEDFFKLTGSDNKFIPTRLVRVDCQPPRLVETSHNSGRGDPRGMFRYAALSYCWGPPEQARSQLKTETSSLPSRLSYINEHDMNEVLRDAVKTCRVLDIPYLWIDALCIIQDDVQDWEHESTLMGKVYANAYLTICALSSDSCNDSFLDRKPPQVEIPFSSKVKPGIHGSYGLRVDPVLLPYDRPGSDISRSVWDKRAWTFQEKAMSVRMLAFHTTDLHFISPWKAQTQHVKTDQRYVFQTAGLGRDGHGNSTYSLIDLWHNDVCPNYSKRLLTYKKDRFPALSGIAQYFGRMLDDEYAAGLWKKTLYRGLYWNCYFDATLQSWDILLDRIQDTSEYVAPSWSWATHDSIDFGFDGVRMFTHVGREYWKKCGSIEVDVILKGVDPFGQIKGASLRITAKICPLPADMEVPSNKYRMVAGKSKMVSVKNSEANFASCYLDWNPNAPVEPRREIMMLLLGTTGYVRGREDPGDTTKSAFGLLIHPVPETEQYFRVGTFYSDTSTQWISLFNDCRERTVVLI